MSIYLIFSLIDHRSLSKSPATDLGVSAATRPWQKLPSDSSPPPALISVLPPRYCSNLNFTEASKSHRTHSVSVPKIDPPIAPLGFTRRIHTPHLRLYLGSSDHRIPILLPPKSPSNPSPAESNGKFSELGLHSLAGNGGEFSGLGGKGPVLRVVLLGWLGAKPRHLKKYVELYNSKGIEAVTFVASVPEVLSFDLGRKLQEKVNGFSDELVSWLGEKERDGRERFLLFHTFSNTGWLAYGSIVENLQDRQDLLVKIKGCIVDSGGDPELNPKFEEDFTRFKGFRENLVADKLDSVLVLMFEHLYSCNDGGRLVEVFEKALLQSFRKTVLTAYKSKFTQFVMFYACSLDPDGCGVRFGEMLADIFTGIGPPLERLIVWLK